ELLRQASQLEHVRVALLAFFGAVLQVRAVAGPADDLVDELRQLALADVDPEPLEETTERCERGALSRRNVGDLLRAQQRLRRGELLIASEAEQAGAGLVADAARRHVQHARERHR